MTEVETKRPLCDVIPKVGLHHHMTDMHQSGMGVNAAVSEDGEEVENLCSLDRYLMLPDQRVRSNSLPDQVCTSLTQRHYEMRKASRRLHRSWKCPLNSQLSSEEFDVSPTDDTGQRVSRFMIGGRGYDVKPCHILVSEYPSNDPWRCENTEQSSPSADSTEFLKEFDNRCSFRPIYPQRSLTPSHTPQSTRSNSPALSVRSLSPAPMRQRANTICCNPDARPRSPWLPRDPIQPSKGSISDLSERHSTEDAGEEVDEFPVMSTPRPRSSTCPENRAWLRRKRRQMANRPPTPPLPLAAIIHTDPVMWAKEHLQSVDHSNDLPEVDEDT